MTPSNLGGGAGSWVPGIVVVALGEPGVPVVCCARAAEFAAATATNKSGRRLGSFQRKYQQQRRHPSDDAACRDAGMKPGTPAYAKCREDMSNRRQMSQMAARIGMQNQIWSQQEMMTHQMMMGH